VKNQAVNFPAAQQEKIKRHMATKRNLQVAELIKRHFSEVLQNEGGYVYGTEPLVTVTKVMVSPDFSQAKIYLSVYNTEDKQSVILKMEHEITRLKQALAYRIRKHMRRVPDVAFYLDDTLDEMYRLNQLFNRLHQEGHMGDEEEQQEG
jgi:ribosome-binding factor A